MSILEIRHSMDEAEFRDLVAGRTVTLKIDPIFKDAPAIKVVLQDVGWDRVYAAIDAAEDEAIARAWNRENRGAK